jgi:hypothetical protein
VLVDDVFKLGTAPGTDLNNTPNESVLKQAVALGKSAGEPIRVILDKSTILVEESEGLWVVVAIKTGHPVAKSLRRMLRRSFKMGAKPVKETRELSGGGVTAF